ncbi:IS3 family transposase, partial [Paenibacillus alvei]|nr:IS3 family transposase [Paenibacillus alvei]
RDYITYYNSIRIQTKLNNKSPINFRRLLLKLVRCFDPCLTNGVSPNGK